MAIKYFSENKVWVHLLPMIFITVIVINGQLRLVECAPSLMKQDEAHSAQYRKNIITNSEPDVGLGSAPNHDEYVIKNIQEPQQKSSNSESGAALEGSDNHVTKSEIAYIILPNAHDDQNSNISPTKVMENNFNEGSELESVYELPKTSSPVNVVTEALKKLGLDISSANINEYINQHGPSDTTAVESASSEQNNAAQDDSFAGEDVRSKAVEQALVHAVNNEISRTNEPTDVLAIARDKEDATSNESNVKFVSQPQVTVEQEFVVEEKISTAGSTNESSYVIDEARDHEEYKEQEVGRDKNYQLPDNLHKYIAGFESLESLEATSTYDYETVETRPDADYSIPAGDTQTDSEQREVETHPEEGIAQVSRLLDDAALTSRSPRMPSSSSFFPLFAEDGSANSVRSGQDFGNRSFIETEQWDGGTMTLDTASFPAVEITKDSSYGKTKPNGHGSYDQVQNPSEDKGFDGKPKIIVDEKTTYVAGAKSREEDERNLDGREINTFLDEGARLTNAQIESSIIDKLSLGNAVDDIEQLVGNHKSISATPTFKNDLYENTLIISADGSDPAVISGRDATEDVLVGKRNTKNEYDVVYETQHPGSISILTTPVEEKLQLSDTSILSDSPDSEPGIRIGSDSFKDFSFHKTDSPADEAVEIIVKNGSEQVTEVHGHGAVIADAIRDDVTQKFGKEGQIHFNEDSLIDVESIANENLQYPGIITESTVTSSNESVSSNDQIIEGNIQVNSTVSEAPPLPSFRSMFGNISDDLLRNQTHEDKVRFINTNIDEIETKSNASKVSNESLTNSEQKNEESNESTEVHGLSRNDNEVEMNANESKSLTEDEKSLQDGGTVIDASEESDVEKTTEGKPKDSIETYSQFAERVAMEQMNDGNGQSGSATGAGGSAVSPKVPRVNPGKKYSKNYAAPDCGSKLLAANPEAQHAGSVIKRDRDEYLLNDCKSKTWFIVELCESIRPSRFEIANFELFSNLPKDVVVYGSQRYPSRDWTLLGEYVAEPSNRGVQAFPVTTEPFFKYIKVEILSHYGTEYYCPISLFEVYGVSEFEVIDSLEDGSEELEEEHVEQTPPKKEENKEHSMLPTVLRSMLYNVLGALNKAPFFSIASKSNQTPTVDECTSLDPRYKIDEKKCSLAPTINWHLGCYDTEYRYLLKMSLISSTVQSREFCKSLVDNLCTEKGNEEMKEDEIREGKHLLSGNQVDLNYACSKEACGNHYVCVMLCSHHLLAMCHIKHFNLATSAATTNSSVPCESANVPNNRSVNGKTTDIPGLISSNFEIKDSVIDKTNGKNNSRAKDLKDSKNKSHQHCSKTNTNQSSDVKEESVYTETLNEANVSSDSNVTFDGEAVEEAEIGFISDDKNKKSSGKKEKKVEGSSSDKKQTKSESKRDSSVDSKHNGNGHRNGDNGSKNGNGSPLPTVEQDPPTVIKDGNGGNVAAAPVNKESVVVRLSNKIKVLEHNLSINSQYLEELSQRYKQQMEEMQMQFSAAVAALNATRPPLPQHDSQHELVQQQMSELQLQMQQLAQMVSQLAIEQETFSSSVVQQHLFLMFVEVTLLLITFIICMRRQRRQMSDHLLVRSPSELPFSSHEALHFRPDSPRSCQQQTPSLNQKHDHFLALQWAKKDEVEAARVLSIGSFEKKSMALAKKALTNTIQRSGSVDDRSKRRRKRDRRASMHNLNVAGPFRDLLRDESCAPSAKRKKKNKAKSTHDPSCHKIEASLSNDVGSIVKGTTEVSYSTEKQVSDDKMLMNSQESWTSKVEGQSSSPLKTSCFDWICESNKCGSSKALNLPGENSFTNLYIAVEDSAILAEALEVALKQGKKVSKETLTRLLLAKMSNEKRIKLAKETRREANRRKSLNKSSAGVLFSCETHLDKKTGCNRPSEAPSVGTDDCSVQHLKTNHRGDSKKSYNDSCNATVLPRPANSCHPGIGIDNHLMRISECSDSSAMLNASFDAELLSDSSESPLHAAVSRRLSSTDSSLATLSSVTETIRDADLEAFSTALSEMHPVKNDVLHPPQKLNAGECLVNPSNAAAMNGQRKAMSITNGDGRHRHNSQVNGFTDHDLPAASVNMNAHQPAASKERKLSRDKAQIETQNSKKNLAHKRTGSDGNIFCKKKSHSSAQHTKTTSFSASDRKKNRKLKRNSGYGSVDDSISWQKESLFTSHDTPKMGSCGHLACNVWGGEDAFSSSRRGDDCKSSIRAGDVRHRIVQQEEEGER
ncbi:uncharacterized protein LOC108665857 isoform X2 [Hyalella azteca]|uniref:Uncharacterized protein LOC108665857 isoform X2 n=1 Tax=Hyalella azteca TaxID=294128 RepID=A0A979FWW3_HYAAZ|nr:uncharacterized protein LOC108665857 isoform X2 [Hyalella azteca]